MRTIVIGFIVLIVIAMQSDERERNAKRKALLECLTKAKEQSMCENLK